MSKGDYVKVRSEIGGKLELTEVKVTQNGGKIEVDWGDAVKKALVYVRLLNRAGNPTVQHTFAVSAVRHIEELISD